jgi:hypothetical protein
VEKWKSVVRTVSFSTRNLLRASARKVKAGWHTVILPVRNIRRKNMKNISCIVFFDPLGEPEAEEKVCRDCWKVWQKEHPEIAGNVMWTFTSDAQSLLGVIPSADFVFFDYGGMCGAGHESLGMSFARELERCVTDYPSTEFILLCTMGKHWYEDDYAEEHPNLHLEEVDWHDLFDKYLGGADV